MTERRRRGTRSSSRCFQSCSALGFLFFMVWVQSGNIEKGSRQLKVKREDKDLTQRAQSPGETGHREKRKSRSLAALGMTTFALSARARARYRRAKKKRRRQSRRGRAEARPYKGKSEWVRTTHKKKKDKLCEAQLAPGIMIADREDFATPFLNFVGVQKR